MIGDNVSRDPYDVDRFRRCTTPPPDVIMKNEEDTNNTIAALRQYLYRPPVRPPSPSLSDDARDPEDSPVPRLLPSLVDDSGDEPMDVDEALTPAPLDLGLGPWTVSDRKAAAMPPPPVPQAKASLVSKQDLAPPARNGAASSPRPLKALDAPSPKRRLTLPASPPRQGARRPLGPRPLSVNTVSMKTDRGNGVKTKNGKAKPKPHRLHSRSLSTPAPNEVLPGTSFSKRFVLNLRFEGRRAQTLLQLVGQHLAHCEQFAQLAALMVVSRPVLPQLRLMLHRTVHLTATNLGLFLRTFVDTGTSPDARRNKLRKKTVRRVPGVKCIILHSVPEFAPWPAAMLDDVLTGAQRLVIRCPLRGPLMQRTIALLASPEQVCLDARAVDGPSALSFALTVLPHWAELKELTIHHAGALQGSRLLSSLHRHNITTPGEYRSQLTSMFEQKRVVYTLDFGDHGGDDSGLCLPEQRTCVEKGGQPNFKLELRDPWDRFFAALNLVDAITVNIIVPHSGRRTIPGPRGADPVLYAMRAKRRGWVFSRIEDTRLRCACGQTPARRLGSSVNNAQR